MCTLEKGRLRLKKTLLIEACLGIILSILFVVFIHQFLKSPSFVNLVERVIAGRMERHVEIGSISFSLKEGPAITIREMVIREGDKDTDPQVVLPQTEIGLSLYGLLSRKLDSIALIEPKFFLDIEKAAGPKPGAWRRAVPSFLKKISIEGGQIVVRLEKGVSSVIGPVNLTVEASPEKKASIKGDVFIPELDSTVSLEAIMEMEGLYIESGHADIGLIELEKAGIKNFALLEDIRLKGSARLALDLSREEDGGLGVEFNGLFEDLSVGNDKRDDHQGDASARLWAFFSVSRDYGVVDIGAEAAADTPSLGKEGAHKASLKGTYDVKGRTLEIESASLSSPSLGYLGISGSFKDFPSRDFSCVVSMKADDISLSRVNGYFLKPLGMGPEGLEYSGTWKGTARVEGSLADGIRWRSEFSIKDLSISSETMKIDFNGKPIRLASRGAYSPEEGFIIRDTAIKAGNINLGQGKEGGFDSSLTNLELTFPYVNYKGQIVRSGDFRLKADRAVFKTGGEESYEEEKIGRAHV